MQRVYKVPEAFPFKSPNAHNLTRAIVNKLKIMSHYDVIFTVFIQQFVRGGGTSAQPQGPRPAVRAQKRRELPPRLSPRGEASSPPAAPDAALDSCAVAAGHRAGAFQSNVSSHRGFHVLRGRRLPLHQMSSAGKPACVCSLKHFRAVRSSPSGCCRRKLVSPVAVTPQRCRWLVRAAPRHRQGGQRSCGATGHGPATGDRRDDPARSAFAPRECEAG